MKGDSFESWLESPFRWTCKFSSSKSFSLKGFTYKLWFNKKNNLLYRTPLCNTAGSKWRIAWTKLWFYCFWQLKCNFGFWYAVWTSIFVSSVNGEKEKSPTLFLPASLLSTGSGGLGFGSRRGGLFDAVAMFPVSDCFKNLHWCLQSTLRSQTGALSIPNPLPFKSAGSCAPSGKWCWIPAGRTPLKLSEMFIQCIIEFWLS